MQYKIPQEVNVEDKIIGPFTLKGFGFVMGFTLVAIIFIVIFSKVGLSFIPSLIIGCFFGSFFLILGFVRYNGKPLYSHLGPFMNFIMKPRQRVWKRIDEKPRNTEKPQNDVAEPATIQNKYVTPKADLKDAESKIEEISLMVDTGGAYDTSSQRINQTGPADMFIEGSRESDRITDSLEKAKETVLKEGSEQEPTVSEMASIDPEKKFDYNQPNTAKYKVDEVIGRDNK